MLSGNAVQFNNQRINESFLVIIDDEISLKQPVKSTTNGTFRDLGHDKMVERLGRFLSGSSIDGK